MELQHGARQAVSAGRSRSARRRASASSRSPSTFSGGTVFATLPKVRRPLQTFGNVEKTVPPEKVDGLRDEALARLRALRERPADNRLHGLRAAAPCGAEARC